MGEETINGQPVTDETVQEWADEAETGYEVDGIERIEISLRMQIGYVSGRTDQTRRL